MREPYLQTGFVRLCWQKLFHLMVLNGLFLLCSAGVLTIPAALTALSRGCQALLLEEPHPFRSFFRIFRESLLGALPLGLLFPLAPAALGYGCLFYVQNAAERPLFTACAVFCLLWCCLLFFYACFAYGMYARVRLSPWAAVKNSFVLLFRGYALGWLLAALLLAAAEGAMLPYTLPWLVLLGASLPCFAAARGTVPVLEHLIMKEELV